MQKTCLSILGSFLFLQANTVFAGNCCMKPKVIPTEQSKQVPEQTKQAAPKLQKKRQAWTPSQPHSSSGRRSATVALSPEQIAPYVACILADSFNEDEIDGAVTPSDGHLTRSFKIETILEGYVHAKTEISYALMTDFIKDAKSIFDSFTAEEIEWLYIFYANPDAEEINSYLAIIDIIRESKKLEARDSFKVAMSKNTKRLLNNLNALDDVDSTHQQLEVIVLDYLKQKFGYAKIDKFISKKQHETMQKLNNELEHILEEI